MLLGCLPFAQVHVTANVLLHLAFLCEAVDHAKDETRSEHLQQLQHHQRQVEEVIAKEGARIVIDL